LQPIPGAQPERERERERGGVVAPSWLLPSWPSLTPATREESGPRLTMFVVFSADLEASSMCQICHNKAVLVLHYKFEAILGQGATKVRIEGFDCMVSRQIGVCSRGLGMTAARESKS